MKPVGETIGDLACVLFLLLAAALGACLVYAVLSGGTSWLPASDVVQITATPLKRWTVIGGGVVLIVGGLYAAAPFLRDFAEAVGMLPDRPVLGNPTRNPLARPVGTAVLSNFDLVLPAFARGHIGGGVSQLLQFHGKVGDAAVETALKELQSRLTAPGRFSRRPILVLQVVPADGEQISTEVLNWVTSCALREGFASVTTLTDLGRPLTEDEFSRMARVLS